MVSSNEMRSDCIVSVIISLSAKLIMISDDNDEEDSCGGNWDCDITVNETVEKCWLIWGCVKVDEMEIVVTLLLFLSFSPSSPFSFIFSLCFFIPVTCSLLFSHSYLSLSFIPFSVKIWVKLISLLLLLMIMIIVVYSNNNDSNTMGNFRNENDRW